MIFRSNCPTSALAAWCRALKHGLGVGLMPNNLFRQQSTSGPAALRDVARRIADRLDTGDSISEALKPEIGRFPVLFVETVSVGEKSGKLTEVLGELENHYTLLQSAKRRLLFSLAWPAFSLFSGIFVLTIMIAVLGMVNPGADPLGLGLTGMAGAFIFLFAALAIVFGIVGIVLLIANDEAMKSKILGASMQVPGLANCVRAFALSRFSLAWRFLAEAGMKADRTMAISLRATANRAYRDHEESAAKKLRKGKEVPDVLADCGPTLFPQEFVEVARIGEESGQLAEVMAKQAVHYQDESERKLKLLAGIAGFLVYACVLLMMVTVIIKLYYSLYIKPINDMNTMIENGKF